MALARLLGMREENVHFIYREGAGCFGRLEPDDAPEDAALMSQAVGKPVRVQWMREDEHGWEPKGPPQLITIRSGLDASGKRHDVGLRRAHASVDRRAVDVRCSRRGRRGSSPTKTAIALGGGDTAPYIFTNRKSTAASIPWMMNPNPLRTANLRAPYSQARCFAAESQIDDMAAAAGNRSRGIPPALPHRRYQQTRRRGAARRGDEGGVAADGPTRSAGRSVRGTSPPVAAWRSPAWRARWWRRSPTSRSTRQRERSLFKKVTVGHDCGLIVNPDGLRNQIEGNVIQGSSRALHGGSQLRLPPA